MTALTSNRLPSFRNYTPPSGKLFPASKKPQQVRLIVRDLDTNRKGVVLSKNAGDGYWRVHFDGYSRPSLIAPDQLSKKTNPARKRYVFRGSSPRVSKGALPHGRATAPKQNPEYAVTATPSVSRKTVQVKALTHGGAVKKVKRMMGANKKAFTYSVEKERNPTAAKSPRGPVKNGVARYTVHVFNPITKGYSKHGVYEHLGDAKSRAESEVRNARAGVRGEVRENATWKVVYSVEAKTQNPQTKFSKKTLAHLRKLFAAVDGADLVAAGAKFDQIFAGTSRPILKQLAGAKIEWVSELAKNALVARRNPAGKKKNMHPLEVGANAATILGGLDSLANWMSRRKKKAVGRKQKAAKKNSSGSKSAVAKASEVRCPQCGAAERLPCVYKHKGLIRQRHAPHQARIVAGGTPAVPVTGGRSAVAVRSGNAAARAVASVTRRNTAVPVRKNFGLISLAESIQAADYLKKRLGKKKKNPSQMVTPGLAKKWLATNRSRKEMHQSRIREMAAAMKAGTYKASKVPILFKDGKLIDGRHRLLAVVKSGVNVKFEVERIGKAPGGMQMRMNGRGQKKKTAGRLPALPAKSNPNDGRIFKEFTGSPSTKITHGFFIPKSEPTNVDQLGTLTEIKLESLDRGPVLRFPIGTRRNAAGQRVFVFSRSTIDERGKAIKPERIHYLPNPSILCAKELGNGRRRFVTAQQQPFILANGAHEKKVHNYGLAVQLSYRAPKPHLYDGDTRVHEHYHNLGEEGGRQPRLKLDNGWFRFHGGDYKIREEGIRD